MPLICYGSTDVGLKRKINQDSIHLDNNQLLYIVADGMGGHKSGDLASKIAVTEMPLFIKNNIKLEAKELLSKAIAHTNKYIFTKASKDEDLKGMGTTIVSILFRGPNIFIGNVGDSRSYLINNKLLYQLTKDHSLIQEKINLGLYGREEGRKDKMKNVITRAVGFETEVEPEIYSYKASKNDLFLLCSDGLCSYVSGHDFLAIINKYIPEPSLATKDQVKKTVQALIDLANYRGGKDNVSVIICLAI